MCSKSFSVKWLIVSFSGIGVEQGRLSGHRTLIIFCKLIAHYMYIAHKFS